MLEFQHVPQKDKQMLKSRFTATAALLLLAAATLSAQQPATQITRAQGAIKVDAVLDDAGWAGADRIRSFVEYEPRDGAEPPVVTEVMLKYDDENVYVAFIAHDPNPSAIRATLQPRDRFWSTDDWIGVMLNPHGDASVAYFFAANPLGVQGDMQMTTSSEDESIDFIYKTEGKITAEGYVVEMAIPFHSLRVPERDVHRWGILVQRTYPRSSRHRMFWPRLSRDNSCTLCQLAQLNGIENVEAGGNLELLPAVVLSHAGQLESPTDPNSFKNGSVTGDASLSMNYTFRPNWVASATLNPDFSQVESDAAQIDVNTTFALFYPERRPFFQKGMDLFQTPFTAFYSRSINAPILASKMTGRAGNTSVGYIIARDEHTPFIVPFADETGIVEAGKSTTNVVRLQHNFGGSKIGGLVTDRRVDGGGSNTTLGTDLVYRFNQMYSMQAHVVLTHTIEPNDSMMSGQLPNLRFGKNDDYTAVFDGESFTGLAGFVWAGRDAKAWSWNALYLGLTPTYRTDAGFEPQNDFHRATVYTQYSIYPNKRGVERVSASLWGGGFWKFYGEPMRAVIQPGFSIVLPRQTNIFVGATVQNETFRAVHFSGLRDYNFSLSSSPSQLLRFGFDAGTGRRIARNLDVPEVANGRNVNLWAAITPIPQLVIEPSISYEQLDRQSGEEIFSGYVAYARANYQYNRELQMRVLLQYNDFNKNLDVEPLLAYQLNPFTIFYVGATYGAADMTPHGLVGTDRQYFMKFQYLIRK
jgi:hypothetical protein